MSSTRVPRPTTDTLSGGYLNGILSNTGAKRPQIWLGLHGLLTTVFPLEDAEVEILSKKYPYSLSNGKISWLCLQNNNSQRDLISALDGSVGGPGEALSRRPALI